MHERHFNTEFNLPPIGFGTGQLTDDVAFAAVSQAITTGYRLVDTAARYNNELAVGRAVREAAVPRQELFVTTKLWREDMGYESTLRAFDGSLRRLGLSYVDLYLVHWPNGGPAVRKETWRAMERVYTEGRAKAIGASNYSVAHLNELVRYATVAPAVNQIEFHPFVFNQQAPTLAYCDQNNIAVEGYCPFASRAGEHDTDIVAIAEAHGKQVGQVMLRWGTQHGVSPLPRSSQAEHIAANFQIHDFKLTAPEMEILDNKPGRRLFDDPATIT